ncbi:hypothetical protein [Mitsuaria sp. GD03876]|uniref:hypothetical protein n=1 Tax=Mitsuaria sp. GD03876 TaxID=2975399 RepID=UPI00244D48C9|nr:hypothetical protein [Mitsuaria sp. GD03876]MDH0865436.1 hypothetical protein [Mitsuaria sp. GD03876]
MNGNEYIAALARANPDLALAEVLAAEPATLARLRQLPVDFSWEPDTRDGWYLLASRSGWEFFFQERGAATHGESFRTLAEAVAWGHAQGRV